MTAQQPLPQPESTAPLESPDMLRRSILSSIAGTALEWYDFYLYGTAAALVFNVLFFPKFDPLTGTLLAFGTYSIGFAARPIGGIIAGHFGDRLGRKKVLVATVALMGASTFLIGLLPTYTVVGVWAPLLLLALRFLQGLSLGGEWAGGALMIAERAKPSRRGFLASFVQVGVPVGNLLSTGLLALLSALLTEQQFLAWGWRIPFILSAAIVGLALYIRVRVAETPAFVDANENRASTKSPVLEVVRKAPTSILSIIGIRIGADIVYYTAAVFSIAYVTQYLKLDKSITLNALLIAAAISIVVYPFFGALSDRIGRKNVTLAGALGAIVWAFAFFPLLNTHSPALVTIGIISGLVLNGVMYGVQASWFPELFETEVRYSGVSIGYQMAGVVGGSLAPLIGVALLAEFDSYKPVVAYLALGLVITIVSVLMTRETAGREL